MDFMQHCIALSWHTCRLFWTIESMFEFMNCKQLTARESGLFSRTIIFLWKSSFLFETEERQRGDGCRTSARTRLKVDYSDKSMYVNVNFLWNLNVALAVKSKPIVCEPFFMARVERKRSLSWMFTKCLQAIFAQVFVTVFEVMKPVTRCGVLWYLWKKQCVCAVTFVLK